MAQKQILTLLRTVEQTHLARESRTLSRGPTREDRAWVTERMAFVVRKSMKTADDVYDAMLSRGFSGPSAVARPRCACGRGTGPGRRRARALCAALVPSTGWCSRDARRSCMTAPTSN